MTATILPDRYTLDALKHERPEILDTLTKVFPQSVTNRDQLGFCGVVCHPSAEPVVFVPRGIPTRSGEDAARLTMLALARYGREKAREGEATGDDGNTTQAAIIAELARDFLQNGLFNQRLRVRTINTGKPDWKRTVTRRRPLLTAHGAPVFLDYDASRFLDANENILALVQAETIRQITSMHGWWIGLDEASIQSARNVPPPRFPEQSFAPLVRKFMRFLFDDRSLSLARLLAAYWDNQTAKTGGKLVCGIPDFSNVWEYMLRSLVNDSSPAWNSRLPLPAYRHADGKIDTRDRGGIIDIVVEQETRIIVADAKYYGATSAATAPGIGDILKQSFYSKAVREIDNRRAVVSLFAFPSNVGAGNLERAEFVQRDSGAEVTWLDPVNCVYLDTTTVLKGFVARSKWDWHSSARP